jgi:DnaK suppressor protein
MEELSDAQVQTLAKSLRDLLEELEQTLTLAREEARPVTLDQQSVGRISRMDAIQQQAMAQNSRRSLELRLGQVKAALGSVEDGEYGDCKRCEEPIGLKRLTAKPEAPLCLECQGGREGR